ncbi:sigma factor [Romboutsia sp. 1001216sp1]|uniref:sigma factor n=1 Tax=Romboutsia sp. 1001216sp1 TaxID=2986997 RepID=UPI00232E4FF9|nr:sigma factor [Romboutsia sp. 1001216sp1]MDB8803613.1 sigma factor [Romboutsia sp. 1001216sp1]MDB8807885.1 sigma factor [Romboutsia sp. 1001216sp1]MDB8809261.1 sigma factor [Romboutsia sp. 1001216sp1]MDB8815009.1 sigma factor [Romboutsia sp. 1001216sp1]MDB8819742.1 sigma factor [Romboutsia sp. 1001216sp1]
MSKEVFQNGDINEIVEENIGFIINTISKVTGKYVSIENDDEFSIGLMAFVEALDKYNQEKGPFLSFAKIVIESRIKNYLAKEKKKVDVVSIDLYKEIGIDINNILYNPIEDKTELINEIQQFKEELNLFKLTIEDLIKEAPKHSDTRENAINVSKKASKDLEVTDFMYEKKRLPIKKISLKYMVTEKVIKRSKKFIISLIIIFFKKYRNLMLWIGK